ncbi:MAG: DUF4013 domain-containing protein [Methanobacterium sp.]|nr:DUF4013 domain-containing protein [Methanobacterium sp.]
MKVIILGFLSLLSLIGVLTELNIFTIPFLIMVPLPLGYLFRIIKKSFEGSDSLPDFDNWKKMYVDGLRVIVIILIYAIPLLLVTLLINPTVFFSINFSAFTVVMFLDLFMKSLIQILLFIIIGLLEFVAIANMVLYDGEILAAFKFRELLKRISMMGWIQYLTAYVLIWVIGFLIILVSLLSLTVLIGILIIPLLIGPYFIILSMRLLALIFASSES